MAEVSYSAHISNGKSAINSKAKLSGVAKHNLRKYRSSNYNRDNIVLLYGTSNLMGDVKRVYKDTFSEALKKYNEKQTRADRRIDDYFEHISGKNQDMAVEIIFQCGDKSFWESVFSVTDNKQKHRENICDIYNFMLGELKRELPDFKIANAVVHFDESSPHMHVVGVPVGRGFKKGLETKVSKRSVFTPKTLETILQDSIRKKTQIPMQVYFGVFLKDKEKGKNYDLTVTEYKVEQEQKKLEKAQDEVWDELFKLRQTQDEVNRLKKMVEESDMQLSEKRKMLLSADRQLSESLEEIYHAERSLSDIKSEGKALKERLAEERSALERDRDKIEKDIQYLKTDMKHWEFMTRIYEEEKNNAQTELDCMLQQKSDMSAELERIKQEKDRLALDVSVLEAEIEKRNDFIKALDKLKSLLGRLLSMIPLVRDFVELVEKKKDISAEKDFKMTPLGKLLNEYKVTFSGREVIFPDLATWDTSQGRVTPIYNDYNGRGTYYTLSDFYNLTGHTVIPIHAIESEITPKTRVCTMEQAVAYAKAVEKFMDDMQEPKQADNREYLNYDKFHEGKRR